LRKHHLRPLLSGCMLGLTLTFPKQALSSAQQALSLFSLSVLPALLPFTACMLLFTSGQTFSMPPLILLSFLGGSPAGARLFQDAHMSPLQARKAAAQTGVMTPTFFLGTLSLWLQSAQAARLLLCCHLLAALLAGCFFKGEKNSARLSLPPLSFGGALAQAAQAMLTAGVCIVMGSVASRMVFCLFPSLPALYRTLIQCLLEVTSGAKQLASLPSPLQLPLLSAFLSFSGLSILLQNAAFWGKHGISPFTLAGMGLLRGCIAFLLCFAILLCLPAGFAV